MSNQDEVKRSLEEFCARPAAPVVPRIVPAMREALAPVVDRLEAQRAMEYEDIREANLARFLPVWEASAEALAVDAAIERQAERDAERASDPSSFSALLNRRAQAPDIEEAWSREDLTWPHGFTVDRTTLTASTA